tara:strand:+ start:4998 stop:5840 length:843 start_codon:yes stop_codon:yes gene_type:complete
MPVNASLEYQLAEQKYREAETPADKLRALQVMYAKAPKHKSSEQLIKWIRETIKKYKDILAKEKQSKKGRSKYSIKKDGAATVVIVGYTNTGKSTLLKELTNAKPLIADYEFTTVKPEIATFDYKGVKIQLIELPAIVDDYFDTVDGPSFLGIVRLSDLVIVMSRNEAERRKTVKELEYIDDIQHKVIYYNGEKNFSDIIWRNLGLVKVFTKLPGKPKAFPPVSLKKGSTVKDLATYVHKDFVKKFKFGRVWGKSAKHGGMRISLNHKLKDDDVVELHMK